MSFERIAANPDDWKCIYGSIEREHENERDKAIERYEQKGEKE